MVSKTATPLAENAPSRADTLAVAGTPGAYDRDPALPKGLGYERRLKLWFVLFGAPSAISSALLAFLWTNSRWLALATFLSIGALLWLLASRVLDKLVRPLHALMNVVEALRKQDFTLRAREVRRGDAVGDLALEINELARSMQQQRTAAADALTLTERVLSSMQIPVLAFDSKGLLRLFNPAAEQAFALNRAYATGRPAQELKLGPLLSAADEGLFSSSDRPGPEPLVSARWIVRRTSFRLNGLPHTLFVLSNIDAPLRDQERSAWQKLIRVLSHEINNSLTPIKSLAGSLLTRLPLPGEGAGSANTEALRTGLNLIENRAESLNRFLHAYQQFAHLPQPTLRRLSLLPVMERSVLLETRMHVPLRPGPDVYIMGDEDQLQQLMINIIRNGVEAALCAEEEPLMDVTWVLSGTSVLIQVRDNGPGLLNSSNLFVPFYTTKPEGSGIGLVLSQQIASGHRGSILLFNNNDGPGCTCELRIPIHLDTTPAAVAANARRL